MSDVKSKNQHKDLFREYKESIKRSCILNYQLQKRQVLHTVIKIRYILEALERICKPTNINEEWLLNTTLSRRWEILLENSAAHPWINDFKQCLNEKILDNVLDLLNCCDLTISKFFSNNEVGLSFLQNSNFSKAVTFLEKLEPKILAYDLELQKKKIKSEKMYQE